MTYPIILIVLLFMPFHLSYIPVYRSAQTAGSSNVISGVLLRKPGAHWSVHPMEFCGTGSVRQSIGVMPCAARNSFVFEKCLHPKKP